VKNKIINNARRRSAYIGLVCVLVVLLQSGCMKEYSDQPLPNQLPKTFFWIFSDTAVATGISKQEIRWWGEDQDGYVVGYLIAISPNIATLSNPDTLTYTYVTTTDSVLSFPLRQAKQTFLVAARAIDNTCRSSLKVGAKIKWSPVQTVWYWDKNKNGIFDVSGIPDSSDVRLDDLISSMDLTGAKQQFPIKNTPPTITYVLDDADNTVYAQPPPVTYTVASFSWIGNDFDGDETITGYRISLNDSTFVHPLMVSSNVTTITLGVPRTRSDSASTAFVSADVLFGTSPTLRKIGTLSGLQMDAYNTLYVQSVDVAGDISKFIRFPSSGRTWMVKRPRGKFLIIADYGFGPGDSSLVRTFYTDSVFNKVGKPYDFLDIQIGSTQTRTYGIYVPARQHLNPALIETYKLYKCIFWYTSGTPSLEVARKTLYYYWSREGGHLLYSTYFVNPGDIPDAGHAYRDIAPLDSLGSSSIGTRFSGLINPDSSIASDIYPVMGFKARLATGLCVFPMYNNAAARNIYFLPPSTSYPLTSAGVIDETGHVIVFNIPLHYLSSVYPKDLHGNDQGVVAFFKKVFTVFGVQ
jgi:hypothetical protein